MVATSSASYTSIGKETTGALRRGSRGVAGHVLFQERAPINRVRCPSLRGHTCGNLSAVYRSKWNHAR